MAKPLIVGLLGGVSSGKSTVAGELARLGARVIDADRLAHLVLRDPAVKQRLRRRWGGEVFKRSGAVDRAQLAARAFASPQEQQALVRITHPPILRRIRAELGKLRARRKPAIVVLDAALLAESGLARLCDVTVFVSCDRKRRAGRASAARGWPDQEVERREHYQIPLNRKQRSADYLVDNIGSPEALLAQVYRLYNRLVHRRDNRPRAKSHCHW